MSGFGVNYSCCKQESSSGSSSGASSSPPGSSSVALPTVECGNCDLIYECWELVVVGVGDGTCCTCCDNYNGVWNYSFDSPDVFACPFTSLDRDTRCGPILDCPGFDHVLWGQLGYDSLSEVWSVNSTGYVPAEGASCDDDPFAVWNIGILARYEGSGGCLDSSVTLNKVSENSPTGLVCSWPSTVTISPIACP